MVFITQAMLYSSAIFYSTSRIAGTNLEVLIPFLELNPIVHIVELSRDIMLWHIPIHWSDLSYLYLTSSIICLLGYATFQLLKPAFSDVV